MTATVTAITTSLPCDSDPAASTSPGWGHAVIVGVFVDDATHIEVARHESVSGVRYTTVALRALNHNGADVDLRIADGQLKELLRKLTAVFAAEAKGV